MWRGGTAPTSALAQCLVQGRGPSHCLRSLYWCVFAFRISSAILGSITIYFGLSTASHEEYTQVLLLLFAGLRYHRCLLYFITCPSFFPLLVGNYFSSMVLVTSQSRGGTQVASRETRRALGTGLCSPWSPRPGAFALRVFRGVVSQEPVHTHTHTFNGCSFRMV